ncbi:MAG: phosphoglycerate dehydrogenase [Planctomycetota bacterium]|nr:phosphoglycerate dehydrogenase [Planctomycetota bacterium]
MTAEAHDILLLERVHDAADATLASDGLRINRIDHALDAEGLASELAGTRMLGIRSKTAITGDFLRTVPHLEAIGCFCIGTNQVDLDAAADLGIAVFNSPFSNTRSVAELTLAEIIALHRQLFDRSRKLHEGQWDKSSTAAHEVRNRTLGIVGYGHIGSQVSVLAEALGMRVIYHDILPVLPLGNARACRDLGSLLEEADVVTLHVPDTPVTRGLVDSKQLELMKPGAVLINNARGEVVNLKALRSALESGSIAGAAIDVFPDEPATNNDSYSCELAGLDNVILSPHIGGSTLEAQEQIAVEVATKLSRFATTGTTTAAVNVPEVELPTRPDDQVRILHFHRNVPGVLSKMHAIIAEHDINITAEYLRSSGNLSYMIMDCGRLKGTDALKRLEELEETIRIRVLRP